MRCALIKLGACLACGLGLLACKPPATNPTKKAAKAGSTVVATDANTSVDTSSSLNSTPTPVQCLSVSGVPIPNQFTDRTLNTVPAVSDCYDSQRTLVYTLAQAQGNGIGSTQLGAQTCYAELSARYGNQLIYPVQNLFPNLYASATMQPPGMQETYLVQQLQTRPCSGFN